MNNLVHLKLYNYFRSSTSFRVRIALELKNLPYEYIPVHLLNNGGEQNSASYRQLNPMGGVPTLVHNDHTPIAQSSAIIEYLDEAFPSTYQLLPKEPLHRAKIREFCQIINADTHPYNNLKTTQYLENKLKVSPEEKSEWLKHWFELSFEACEKSLKTVADQFCFGNTITAADLFLIPQVVSAVRFNIQVEKYPLVYKVYQNCMKLEAFKKAHPFRQIDTPQELINHDL